MRHFALLLAPLALAACDGKEASATKGASFGEVLPGSASDAMLPYDTATSAPPLEPLGIDEPTSAREAADAPAPVDGETVPDAQPT